MVVVVVVARLPFLKFSIRVASIRIFRGKIYIGRASNFYNYVKSICYDELPLNYKTIVIDFLDFLRDTFFAQTLFPFHYFRFISVLFRNNRSVLDYHFI